MSAADEETSSTFDSGSPFAGRVAPRPTGGRSRPDVLKRVAKKLQSSLAMEEIRPVQPPSNSSRASCLSSRTDELPGWSRMISS